MIKEEVIATPDQTASKKQWLFRHGVPSFSQELQKYFKLNPITANILSSRGFSLDEIQDFLDPKLASSLPDPFVMKDMKQLSVSITKAVLAKKTIGIIGDYDVDGATSTAIMLRFFKRVSIPVFHYIPDRIEEGYGPSLKAFDYFKKQNITEVIAVDCGTTAFDILSQAKQKGFNVHILDHHEPTLTFPECHSLVNPRRFDDDSGLDYLAAVGVAFMALVAINRNLREVGYYKDNNISEPKLMDELDLVALGTVCDVVPLKGLNRALVAQGLKVMRMRKNVGLKHLCDIAALSEEPQAWHMGFMLGPRINAGGRVGEADHGAKLLSCDDDRKAEQLALELDTFNKQRQAIEQDILVEVENQLANIKSPQAAIIIGDGQWHSGVVGIIASRLKERYYKPALVWCSDKEGNYVGSGRSVPGVDLGAMILSAVEQGILCQGGGHSQAAGFTVKPEKLDEFKAYINERVSHYVEVNEVVAQLHVDAVISSDSINIPLMEDLEKLAPFGMNNPQPKFVINVEKLVAVTPVGVDAQHLRCILNVERGANITAMAFRVAGTPMEQMLLGAKGKPITLAGTLKFNHWNGTITPQVIIEDAAVL